MSNTGFLNQLASYLWDNYLISNKEVMVVLPTKRAKVFLLKALQQNANKVLFAPRILSIEQFMGEVSGIRLIDTAETLLQFYTTYSKITPSEKREDFESFSKWANTLLADFNEIDRYLLEPNSVFQYLKEAEALKRWDLEPEHSTELIQKYLIFWNTLPQYYQAFYQDLKVSQQGYQGLVCREAVLNLQKYIDSNTHLNFVFAGFNALNKAEEHIFQYLLKEQKAEVFWDADAHFLEDPYHDAGWFLRKIKNEWAHYKSHPFEWISNSFSQDKEIHIIGTPKSVGQARVAGDVVKQLIHQPSNLEHTALVLADEHLLIPVLHSLPQSIPSLNITMSYPAKSNPVQILLQLIFKMQLNAQKRNASQFQFYHKELIQVLNHPLLIGMMDSKPLLKALKKNNISFLSFEKLSTLFDHKHEVFDWVFSPWQETSNEIMNRILSLLVAIRNHLKSTPDQELSLVFVHALYQSLQKLQNHIAQHHEVLSLKAFYDLFKQSSQQATVSFEGEPLEGLQIMGILESRGLDFENVIITSMNEGTLPAGKSAQSFIPYDIKRELGLPTYKEKDAVFAYHFYSLMKRAQKVYLIYNTETEGLEQGEKSRFITQLEVENLPNHQLVPSTFAAEVPGITATPRSIEKSPNLTQRLQEIAQSGFSPSSLASYIRNPLQFYYQKVLKIREEEEVEEEIAANTLGSVIHKTLEDLYTPYLNGVLTPAHLKKMAQSFEKPLQEAFKSIYKEGEINRGKNLIAYEVTKKYIQRFLTQEEEMLQSQEIIVDGLEQKLAVTIDHPELSFPVVLNGTIDRVDQFGGQLRIIDYKTGKVIKNQLKYNGLEELLTDVKKDKIFQLLCYAYMYHKQHGILPEQACIYSFKNAKEGIMSLNDGKNVLEITPALLDDFEALLVSLIKEILDPAVPIVEKLPD